MAGFQLGSEDEGEALLEWRAKEGWPKKLTFYAPTAGDVYSHAPYVDEIQ